jgi:NAD(P) transhydrogenase subunit alpha
MPSGIPYSEFSNSEVTGNMNAFKLACLLAVTASLIAPKATCGAPNDSSRSAAASVSALAAADASDAVQPDEKADPGKEPSNQLGELITYLTVFVLAIFVGFEVITKVPPTLHTPLMSGSNAISGITVIGALLLAGAIDSGQPGTPASQLAKVMAFVAVIFATINVVGGFLVTHRMLRMFKR